VLPWELVELVHVTLTLLLLAMPGHGSQLSGVGAVLFTK
jgi:hypothetical protein